jgi:hypothetical protein
MYVHRLRRFAIFLTTLTLLLPIYTQAYSIAAETNQQVPQVAPQLRSAQYPNVQQAKLLAGDKANDDELGRELAISSDGTTALFGAEWENDNASNPYLGAAYVFVRSGNTWTQQAKLVASDRGGYDRFGTSVALSADGNIALIGADVAEDASTFTTGAVYVFTRSGSTWTQQTKLFADDRQDSDFFGVAVSLNADATIAIIGANGENDSGKSNNGAAYIFTRSGNIWTQQAKLLASDRASNDVFGNAVKIDANGTTALIGAVGKVVSGAINNGAAYIFTRSGSTWTQQAKLLASDIEAYAFLGIPLALSSDGNTALLGSPYIDSSGVTDAGVAYIFTRSGTTWTQQARLSITGKSQYDYFGSSAALSSDGNTALIGAVGKDIASTSSVGAAYIFTRSGTTWTQQISLIANDRAAEDWFGAGVALNASASVALVGAEFEDDSGTVNNGAIYVFDEVEPTATPTGPTPIPPRPDTVGLFIYDSEWYLCETNATTSNYARTIFGHIENQSLPVVGDWNGDGIDTLGLFRINTGIFLLSNSNFSWNFDYTVLFGNPGDIPFAGRWTADMTGSGIGVYRDSNGILYQRKSLTSGVDDYFAVYGNPGDKPIAGDWDGDGFDSIGIYRPSNQTWYLTNNSTPSGITLSDSAFVWSIGDGEPFAGDWDGDGDTNVGFRSAAGVYVLHTENAAAGADIVFAFGPVGGKPVAGKWFAPFAPALRGVTRWGDAPQPGVNSANPDNGAGD